MAMWSWGFDCRLRLRCHVRTEDFGQDLKMQAGLKILLGGSWVNIRGVLSPRIWVESKITLRVVIITNYP